VDHAPKFEVILRENLGEGGVLTTEVTTLARYLADVVDRPRRERLPAVRQSVTRKFHIARPGHRNGDLRMYVTVGLYPDGRPGEIFIRSDYLGSFASGALDAVAMVLSVAWQHGVPFRPVIEKLRGTRFEPQGATGDPEYGIVTSPLDYVAKWLLRRFGGEQEDPGGSQDVG
jgi:ribonucleoside-diphosphate reductase alpha chain